jgi:hypothetical protein
MSRWQADVELVMCSVKTDGFGMTFLLWLQGEAPRAAPAVPMLGVLDPQPPRFGDAAPPLSVSQQADDVLNIIEYRTARRNVCDMVRRGNVGVAVSRGELACKLDELHILSLKSAVLVLEPKSAGEIGQMKSWAMNNLARPGQMAHCDDGTLFGFIASKLMAQDVSLAEESAIDDEFATYLSRSNSVRKSLTAVMAQTAGMARAAGGVPPPRVVPAATLNPICPKCHHGHFLRECTAEFATMYRDGPRNHGWKPRGRPRPGGRNGGGGPPAPYGGRPALLAP